MRLRVAVIGTDKFITLLYMYAIRANFFGVPWVLMSCCDQGRRTLNSALRKHPLGESLKITVISLDLITTLWIPGYSRPSSSGT